jgi:hypothetical protein
MMPIAQKELTTGGRMVAHAPAAWLVTVVLPYELVHAGGDCPDDAELGKV